MFLQQKPRQKGPPPFIMTEVLDLLPIFLYSLLASGRWLVGVKLNVSIQSFSIQTSIKSARA